MKAKKFPPGGGTPSGAYQGVDIESPYQQGHSTTSATELQERISCPVSVETEVST